MKKNCSCSGQGGRVDILTERLTARFNEIGGVETAKEYVRRETAGLDEAFRRLGERQTLEGLMLRYGELFDPESLALAGEKLDALRKHWEGDP